MVLISNFQPDGMEFNSTIPQTQTLDILTLTTYLLWVQPVQIVMDIQFYITVTVLLIAPLEPTTTDKLVSNVLIHNHGTELTVLTDVQMVEFGMLPHNLVYAH